MINDKENFAIQDFIIQLEQISYLDILYIIEPLIIFFTANKLIDIYKLHKECKPKSISKVLKSPELSLEYSEIDINKYVAEKYDEFIVKFVEVIINNFSEEDLTYFYNNIYDLKMKKKKIVFKNLLLDSLNSRIVGEYNHKKNEIVIDDKYESADIVIYHELFHMASTTYKYGIGYSGFRQMSLKPGVISLGTGLNEGYTELLTQRYFGPNSYIGAAYQYQVIMAEKIEQIIGKEKMQSLYLNSNLKGLIEELEQYVSEEEIMGFIANTDFLYNHMDDKKYLLSEKNLIVNCLKNINRFVIICYSKMLQQQIIDGEIFLNDEILQKLANYISSLPYNIEMCECKYEVMIEEDIPEILFASFENTDVAVPINREEQLYLKI